MHNKLKKILIVTCLVYAYIFNRLYRTLNLNPKIYFVSFFIRTQTALPKLLAFSMN